VSSSSGQVKSLLTRFVDYLKTRMITSIFTELMPEQYEQTPYRAVGVSSIMDTWIALRHVEKGGVRRKMVGIVKSRGMNHASEFRELRLSDKGVIIMESPVGISSDSRCTGQIR
jgi:circadian clock protein KaiC